LSSTNSSSKCLSRSIQVQWFYSGFLSSKFILRSIQVQLTVLEDKEGKKKVMIVNFNELAFTELIVSMDDKIKEKMR
jgi:hypothetical protein